MNRWAKPLLSSQNSEEKTGIFAGKAELCSEGAPAYTLNLLTGGGIKVRDVRIDGDKMRFSVTEAELPQAEKILTENDRIYRVAKAGGLKRRAKEFVGRYALIAGVLISCALTYVYSTLVAEVEIRGNALVSEEVIAAAVSEYVETPRLFAYPDLESIEKAVLRCDGVAYAKVVREGKRIVVEIVEELPETEITDTQNPIPLLARESGVITRIVTLRGTAEVECGDTVKAGDVLIAVNGKEIHKMAELQEESLQQRPGDEVTVTYLRDKKKHTAKVTLRNAQGTTTAVTNIDVDAMGVALRPLTDQEKREFDLGYGLVITAIRDGKMKEAGMTKGLILLQVNDRQMRTREDFEEAVKEANMTTDRILWIRAKTQSGLPRSFTVELGEKKDSDKK